MVYVFFVVPRESTMVVQMSIMNVSIANFFPSTRVTSIFRFKTLKMQNDSVTVSMNDRINAI